MGMIQPDFCIARMHDIDESYPADLSPEEIPAFLSRLKASAYGDQLEDGEVIVTADTVVICDGNVLGKPHSMAEAEEMLHRLRDRSHTVVTGVTLTSRQKTETFSESTEVTFGHLTDEEIHQYVEEMHPLDKAGSYGIQEWIGAAGIVGIKGCFYNVIGLPLHALYKRLSNF